MKKTILALAALAAGVSAYAAKPADLAVTLDVTYVSTYVFRGLQLSDDAIQPSIEASYQNFYAGVWYTDDVNASETSEADLYAGYNLAINETFSADLGVTRYTYDGSSSLDTTEAFVGLKADVVLSPSVYYYYDFDQEISSYVGSIGHSFPIAQIGVSLDLSATVGFVQRPDSINGDYTYWGVGAAVPYKLSETAKLTAAVNYTSVDTKSPGDDFGVDSNAQDQVVFSLGLSVGF